MICRVSVMTKQTFFYIWRKGFVGEGVCSITVLHYNYVLPHVFFNLKHINELLSFFLSSTLPYCFSYFH